MKINNSFVFDENFVLKITDHIAKSIETLNKENLFDDQKRWEFLKFEIRKFFIQY